MHNTPLTTLERLRTRGADAYGAEASVFGKRYTYWETPDGTPVSMAGVNPLVGGQVRVDPVYTPTHLRDRGYATAVTGEVSRAALDAGAKEVVLFTNPANPTSNALYCPARTAATATPPVRDRIRKPRPLPHLGSLAVAITA
ncbi:GNAT family N-acetyltransferase [Streptomyces sp. NPDC005209]|uniref:GNAT family N-acetyltransferase n=1 Tax=Streptomyces sp. NPDC005209 TaxID=3156715 RepID=UPI0033A7BC8C